MPSLGHWPLSAIIIHYGAVVRAVRGAFFTGFAIVVLGGSGCSLSQQPHSGRDGGGKEESRSETGSSDPADRSATDGAGGLANGEENGDGSGPEVDAGGESGRPSESGYDGGTDHTDAGVGECSADDDCVFLENRSCCPGPPTPCDRGGEVGTLEEQEEIRRWREENCDATPIQCPQYAPPLCGDCYDLLSFKARCNGGNCVRADTIDCEQLCAAAVKDPEEECPWISHPDLLTEENIQACEPAWGGPTPDCTAVDPDSFGDCSTCGGCSAALGAGFDGAGCFYINGCTCEPSCSDLFATLDECRSACGRSCFDIASDILEFRADNSACGADSDCVAVEGSFAPLYQHCSCTLYLNRQADFDRWERLNLEWSLFPNGGSERCGGQGLCCDEVPPAAACGDGVCQAGSDPG